MLEYLLKISTNVFCHCCPRREATTCHQDSAWTGAESRQDRVIVEVVRKAIVVGKCCSMFRTHLTAVQGQQLSYFGCGRKEVRGTAGQRLQLIIPVTPAAWQLLRLSSGTTATIGVHVNGMPLPLAHQLNQLDTCFNKSARNRALKWLETWLTFIQYFFQHRCLKMSRMSISIWLVSAARQKNDIFYTEVVMPLQFLQP